MADNTMKRMRSPNYPSMDLSVAIQRASTIFLAEGRSAVPDDAVLEDWGYKARSGTSMSALAAVKHFGLLESVGKGTVRLTDLAMTILLNEPDSAEREEAIQEAALMPTLHREIVERHPTGLPSDATLRVYLVRDRGFNDSAANELIREIRATFDYAGITFGDKGEKGGAFDKVKDAPNPLGENLGSIFKGSHQEFKDLGVTSIPVFLPGPETITISGRFPISEPAWNQFITVLNAMKLGLVENEEFDSPSFPELETGE